MQFKANFTFLDKKPEGDGDSSTPAGYRGPVHLAPEGFENGAHFYGRLGLPYFQKRHENFSKMLLKPEENGNAGFALKCGRKTF